MGYIYCIENTVNHKKYIGQSKNVDERISIHKSRLLNNKHSNSHLQSSWNKYGKNNFSFSILQKCNNKDLTKEESFWINQHNTMDSNFGYNKKEAGNTGKMTLEIRAKISEAGKGKTISDKTKLIISEKNKGNKYWLGKHHSLKTKEKLREIFIGREIAQEVKEKMAKSQTGAKKNNSSSQFFGVIKQPKYDRWYAQITIHRKSIYIGSFKNEKDAAIAYNNYIIANSLPNPLNFSKKEE